MLLNIELNLKQCCMCFEFKTINFFNKDKTRKDGFNPRCRPCYSRSKKEFYEENKERLTIERYIRYHEDIEESRRLRREDVAKNKERENKRQKKNREKDPIRFKGYVLKSHFGITIEQFNELLNDQDYRCAICEKFETAIEQSSGNTKKLSVDHDHKTGIIRGLLCARCNLALGKLKEDKNIINRCILYLQGILEIEKIVKLEEALNLFDETHSRIKLVHKRHRLKKFFGITFDSFKEMYLRQGGKCKICRNTNKNNYKSLAVDHDHKTGKIRGLLCESCNGSLGKFLDDVNILKNAIKYLEKYAYVHNDNLLDK